MDIGDWVRRTGRKWHLVESIIDGDAILKCGRRMGVEPGKPLEVSDVEPLTRMIGQPQNCKQCS